MSRYCLFIVYNEKIESFVTKGFFNEKVFKWVLKALLFAYGTSASVRYFFYDLNKLKFAMNLMRR
jgi:hypothetical protein